MHPITNGAVAPGVAAPQSANALRRNDEAETTASTALGFKEHETQRADLLSTSLAEQAVLTLEGEHYAAEFLARVDAGIAQPAELSLMVSWLGGAVLDGLCRAIQKRLEAQA